MLALVLAALGSSAAAASPLTWLLSATFSGSAGLSGSFVYDAETNVLQDVVVESGADGDFAGSLYTVSNPSFGPYGYEFTLLPGLFADATGQPVLDLQFFPALTDNGGPVFVAASEYACGDADCTFPLFEYRAGEGTVTAVIEPGPGTMLGAGFVLVGLIARQKRMREPTRKDGPGV